MSHPCPDPDATATALHLGLPRGRAWRTTPGDALDGSVIGRFWRAVAGPMSAASRRLCSLIDEFFCSTAVETLDAWALDYGLPDPCDPFLDVCSKVSAVGDTTMSYAIAVAASRGWSISIAEEQITAAQSGTFGFSQFGSGIYAAQQGVVWRVVVSLPLSLAFTGVANRASVFGNGLFGLGFDCPPDIEPLRCLLRRIRPAQVELDITTLS